jgi:hypothetical protein
MIIATPLNLFGSISFCSLCNARSQSRAFYAGKDASASISEIKDGIYIYIYRISGLVPEYDITFNELLNGDDIYIYIYIYISQAVIGSVFL